MTDLVVVTRDVARRAETYITGGSVLKGVELLLLQNVNEGKGPAGHQTDCSDLLKRGLGILQTRPFELLGVEITCKTADVRKAYKKLALKYHPDKNPKTTLLFQLIQNASTKLSNSEDRQKEAQLAQKSAPVNFGFANNRGSTKMDPPKYNYPPNTNSTKAPSSHPYGANNYPNSNPNVNPSSNANSNPYAYQNSNYQQYQQYQQNQQKPQQPQQPQQPKPDEPKRRNYYEDLLREQYRKAAESDQRAREFAAKRSQDYQFHKEWYENRTNGSANSKPAPPTSEAPGTTNNSANQKASDPPLNSYRAGQQNSNNSNPPPSSFDWKDMYNNNKKASEQDGFYPTTGQTYKTTSDGRVYPQEQQTSQPRPASTKPSPEQNTSPSLDPNFPSMGPKVAEPINRGNPNAPNPATMNKPVAPKEGDPKVLPKVGKYDSFTRKVVVPKPFALKLNSVTSTSVELEWKVSLLYHLPLAAELSWRNQTLSGIWEVAEKLIRNGCCRKKNLTTGCLYEFRVRAVEDSQSANKSDWTDILNVTLPGSVPPEFLGKEKDFKSPSKANLKENINVEMKNEENLKDSKFEASTPIKKKSSVRFRRFNSKYRNTPSSSVNTSSSQNLYDQFTQVTEEGNSDSDTEKKEKKEIPIKIPKSPEKNAEKKEDDILKEPTKSETPTKTLPKKPTNKNVLSSSAREAWGKETLFQSETPISPPPNPVKKEDSIPSSPKKKDDIELDNDVTYLDLEGSDDFDLSSKKVNKPVKLEKKDEDEISEDEELVNQKEKEKKKKKSIKKTKSKIKKKPNTSSSTESSEAEEVSSVASDNTQEGAKKKNSKPQNSASKSNETPTKFENDNFEIDEELIFLLNPPMDKNGRLITHYQHPVYKEPFARSDLLGYLIYKQNITVNANCGDWLRVRCHTNANSGNNSRSQATLLPNEAPIWGWSLRKDRHHEFMKLFTFHSPETKAPSNTKNRRTPTNSTTSNQSNTSTTAKSARSNVDSKEKPNISVDSSTGFANFRSPPAANVKMNLDKSIFNKSLLNIPKPSAAYTPEPEARPAKKNPLSKDEKTYYPQNPLSPKTIVEEWYECYDDMGNIYYFNEKTNVSAWEPPEWCEEIDPATGANYYVHVEHVGGKPQFVSTWNKPNKYAKIIRETTSTSKTK